MEKEKKIVALKDQDDPPEGLDFDLLVYAYENHGYEGSGFAVWKKGDKYFYHEMGHCSCNGAWDMASESKRVPHTLEQILEITPNYRGEYSDAVIKYLKENV